MSTTKGRATTSSDTNFGTGHLLRIHANTADINQMIALRLRMGVRLVFRILLINRR